MQNLLFLHLLFIYYQKKIMNSKIKYILAIIVMLTSSCISQNEVIRNYSTSGTPNGINKKLNKKSKWHKKKY
jgi:hypothetical protein